jgi:hypothetical protein
MHPLAFQARLFKGDFIVVAASDQAERKTSLGNAMIYTDRQGVPMETVVLLTPEVITPEVKSVEN